MSSTRGKRLDSIEDQRNRVVDRRMRGWSSEQLQFYAIYGFELDRLGNQLPPVQEFTLGGIKITVTSEWESEDQKTCKPTE